MVRNIVVRHFQGLALLISNILKLYVASLQGCRLMPKILSLLLRQFFNAHLNFPHHYFSPLMYHVKELIELIAIIFTLCYTLKSLYFND